MKRLRAGLALAACAFGVAAACGDAPEGLGPPPEQRPVATANADPAELLVGDRSVIEIRVTTAADQHLLPTAMPGTVAGVEILGVETLPVEERSGRRLQRTRVTLRAREVGAFEWPAQELRVAGPDGSETRVTLAPLPLVVRSILTAFPGRAEPFGPRAAPEPRRAPSSRPFLAAGGAALLAAWIVAALWRRARRAAATRSVPVEEPAWTAARIALERAEHAPRPADAAHAMAAALRSYMARRFGARSDALTTEELIGVVPPLAATSRWPGFVSLLRELDDLRFAAAVDPSARARVAAARTHAIGFVEATTPPPELQ